ncbi:hypothetical protein KVR01_013753 [Diaporthe batatas]|uniref:uncharacterized protein n=1 Tax=Diaporthe batatas TaxID=748121 RepID=UPI001D053653|nr:uncharacterized protein KVR01_013753 [Diaporthe batatas]KAG8156412.1 hypothetical protein KVR01_013753 [Diaporthe batatas]
MAPKQKTFELIPDLPGVGMAQQVQHQQSAAAAAAATVVQSRPPMTTKQAKKLYRQKGKGPKLSKAEQRRIDLMEQDRIRKEFEKEKAQARARTARDKKKAKEDKERDDKRRKGLPLVEVHPSQDTISRFISRLGARPTSNTRLASVHEAEAESATEAESDAEVQHEQCEEPGEDPRGATGKENEDPADALADSAERTAKRRRLDRPGGNLLDRMIHIPSQLPARARPVARVAQEVEVEAWSRPSSVDADDPATEAMLEDQLIADVELASSKSAARSSPNRQSPPREVPPLSRAPLPAPPRPPSRPQLPAQQKLQARQIQAGTRPPIGAVHHTGAFRPRPADNTFKKPVVPFVHADKQSHALRGAWAISPGPPKFKPPSAPIIPRSAMPRFLPKPAKPPPIPLPVQASPTYAGSRRPANQAADAFPTSTQLLVMNHVDELFPSSSQEARELLEDHPPAAAATIPSGPPSPLHNPTSLNGGRAEPSSDGRPSSVAVPRRPSPPSGGQPGETLLAEIPFLATQDLILSSQDMIELETPSKVREGPSLRGLHVTSPRNDLPLLPENLTLCPDDKNQAPSDAQASCPVMAPTTIRGGAGSHCSQVLAASKSGPGPCGTPLGKTAEEVIRCPTQAHMRPRSQRLQASRNGSLPSRPTSQVSMLSPPRKRGGVRDAVGQCQPDEGFGCRPLDKPSQPDSPSDGSTATKPSPKGCAMPPAASPPKKRMFGSSGPGAEVLVAMERSYRESLAEERRRKEELRLQARKVLSEEPAKQDHGEIVEDDLIDDEIDFGAIQACDSRALPDEVHSAGRSPAASGLRSPIRMSTCAESHAPCGALGRGIGPVASQETDYGDFDFEAEEELDVLADITWADDDLSDI